MEKEKIGITFRIIGKLNEISVVISNAEDLREESVIAPIIAALKSGR